MLARGGCKQYYFHAQTVEVDHYSVLKLGDKTEPKWKWNLKLLEVLSMLNNIFWSPAYVIGRRNVMLGFVSPKDESASNFLRQPAVFFFLAE